MLYAVTDIETTGGYAQSHRIIEISIWVTNGQKVIRQFSSLINPDKKIPPYISGLTGISEEMTESAPRFSDIASSILECLEGTIFVAHSVNFDYSFIRQEFERSGILWQAPRLCTVKLGRAIFPGLPSYSLGALCQSLKIPIDNRHRADGDAKATVKLFHLYFKANRSLIETESGSRKKVSVALPPNIPQEQFEELPEEPGVYYFHNAKGQVIYVGKAKNIKSRVRSHFNGRGASRRVQDLNRQVHGIRSKVCGNELVASLLESHEIRRLWPVFNQSQKRADHTWGIFMFTGRDGYSRLGIGKSQMMSNPLQLAASHREAVVFLMENTVGLCPKRSFLHAKFSGMPCPQNCLCQCGAEKYNQILMERVKEWKARLSSYLVIGPGRNQDEKAFAAVNKGRVEGFGFLEPVHKPRSFYDIWLQLQRTRPNPTAMHLVQTFVNHPDYEIYPLEAYEENPIEFQNRPESEFHSLGI